jgi:formamidopyrimidine-DNA glycosylase
MPELPEVELYRRLAEHAVGRRVASVATPDAWYLKRGATPQLLSSVLVGRTFTAARRRGKLLLLDVSSGGGVLGLRFGMSGRLLVDDVAGVSDLLYSSNRAGPQAPDGWDLSAWDRFAVRFADGGALVVRDPRRLGGVELDPDEARLGPDAATVTPAQLRTALDGSHAPLKARLMDQSRLAGVGNLIADEALWRAGLDPARAAGSLTTADVRRLHRHLVGTIFDFVRDGGSHTGALLPHRVDGGRCPRDGAPLVRRRVGGRTTWSCPEHQR